MTIRCAIMQPTYLPWMGYFALIDAVDVFVILDTVQLIRRSWQVRNRIKDTRGQELLLSVPVRKTRPRDELMLKDAVVNDEFPWRHKHLASFRQNYRKAEYFNIAMEIMEKAILDNKSSYLSSINHGFILQVVELLGVKTKIIRASDIPVKASGKARRLAEICSYLDASIYVSPAGSACYLEEEESRSIFEEAGIDISYQNYKHPEYKQINGPFLSHLSVLDIIANVGPEEALEMIRMGHEEVSDASLLS